jgi:hypothetical protein
MSGRRFVVLAAAAGVLTGLWLTWPLALHPASTVLDDGTFDAFQFIWNVWWVREALLRLHTSPFFTRYLFYPEGISLLFHTFSPTLGLMSIPLQLLLPGGVVTAHNVLVIGAPALAVVTTGLLAREVTGDPWAALAAGLVASVNAAMIWFLPIIYLTSSYLIAAVLWAWWRMHRRRRPRDVVLVLALLAALVFASQEYAMMALALLALDTVARLAASGMLGLPRAWWGGAIATWVAAALGLVLLALAARSTPANPPPVTHLMLGSGYLAAFLAPPWLAPQVPAFWTVLYLGTAPFCLLVLVPAGDGRRAAFWGLAAVVTALMACGPYVGWQHAVLANPAGVAALSIDHVAPGHVPGPYFVALRLVSLLRYFRAPYRWVAATQLAVAVLVALGLAGLRARIVRPALRRLATAAALVAIIGLGYVDAGSLRAPIVEATIPDAYAVLRDDPEPAAVLELPAGLANSGFANLSSRYMFYQTAHRKYLLEGTVARLPPGLMPVYLRHFASFADTPWIKYVVIHRDLTDVAFPVSRTQIQEVEALLATQGNLVLRDGPIEVYRLTTFRPAA